MEALWREQLRARADAVHAEIGRLRAAQQLPRGDRLKRISPALKHAVGRLLCEAAASRKLLKSELFSPRAGSWVAEADEDEEAAAAADAVEAAEEQAGSAATLLTLVPFLEATFTRKRCAKFLQDFVPPSAAADLTLGGGTAAAGSPSAPAAPAWPVQRRAGSGLAHIVLVDRENGAQHARFSTRISAVRPIEGILTYLSKFFLQNETQGVELFVSIGSSSSGTDGEASILHLDCALTAATRRTMSEYITTFWKGEAADRRQIRVTCAVTVVKPRQQLTGTFTVEAKPVFRLSFPAEPSACIDLRECRQLIEDAVWESPLVDDAAERHTSRLFGTAILDGKWNFLRRGLAIPLGDEPGTSALELAIETGSARMMRHSMEETLRFAVSYVH